MSSLREADVTNNQRLEVLELSEAGKISESDVQGDSELKRIYRDLSLRSLYFFAKCVLRYRDMTVNTHMEFCRMIQDDSIRKFLGLVPRGCFKTSIGTISYPIWCLLRDPNDTILIANQIAKNAELMLLEIEGHVDGSNPMMNWLFPERIKASDKHKPFNQQMMNIPGPGRDRNNRNPSIVAIGVGGRAESLHFRRVVNDDLVGEKARDSEIEMLTAIAWHDYAVSLMIEPEKDHERWYGTRWGPADMYEKPIKSNDYKVFWRPAEDLSKVNPDGSHWLFFPERLSAKFLRELRERNFLQYMSQYQNDPQSPEGQEFRKDWLKYFELTKTDSGPVCEVGLDEKYPCSEMDIGIFVDPAGSGDLDRKMDEDIRRATAKKSVNVVAVVGKHGSGRVFVLDMWYGRGLGDNPELEVAQKMLEMAQRWQGYARRGWVEAYGAQSSLITIYNLVCSKAGYAFRYEELPRGENRAKKVRIRGAMGGIAQQGLLHCRRIQDLFIYEFGRFAASDAMDTLDAVTWGINTLHKPYSPVERQTVSKRVERRRRVRLASIGRAGY